MRGEARLNAARTGSPRSPFVDSYIKALNSVRKPFQNPPIRNFDVEAVGNFIPKVFAASMKKYYTDEAWARKAALDRPDITQAWKALYHEVQAELAGDTCEIAGGVQQAR